MNYIHLINNFWELDEQWQFTCCETRLYFYLIKTANRLGWVDNWTHSDAKVSANVGVSEKTLKTARNKLIQAELIDFKPGGKFRGDKNKYQILTTKVDPNSEEKPIKDELGGQILPPYSNPYRYPNSTPNGQPKRHPLNKHKLNKTINTPLSPNGEIEESEKIIFPTDQKKEKEKSSAKKEKIDLSFVDKDFLSIIERWLSYKADKRQKYKNADSIQTMYKKLLEYSKNNAQSALEIIEDAMSKNYSGFFELKIASNETTKTYINNSQLTQNEAKYGSIREAKQAIIDNMRQVDAEFAARKVSSS